MQLVVQSVYHCFTMYIRAVSLSLFRHVYQAQSAYQYSPPLACVSKLTSSIHVDNC
jgi:hypothetical protein